MKLISNPKWPHYLKRDPVSGFWRVYTYQADKSPPRLDKSTGEKVSIERAKKLALDIYEKWLGHKLDGGKIRVLFTRICDEKLERMEAQLIKGKIRQGTLDNAKLYLGTKIDKETGKIKNGAIREEFGHFYVDQINEEQAWGGFVARFQKQHSDKTLFNHWKAMMSVMRHAYRSGYIEKPWFVENPDPEKLDDRVPSQQEVDGIYANALQNLKDQMLFGSTMGMRKMEHLRLSWRPEHCCHVNLDTKTVHLCPDHSKTGKPRSMAMSPQVYGMLLRRKEGYYRHGRGKSDTWVFPARGNGNTHVKNNKSAWRSAKKAAGITGTLKYHWLRRFFLTECAKLVREGHVSVVLVCNYAGLSIRTFERKYLKLTHKDTAPVANLVAVKLRENDASLEVRH